MKQYLLIFIIAISAISCKSKSTGAIAEQEISELRVIAKSQAMYAPDADNSYSLSEDYKGESPNKTKRQKKISKSAYYKFKENNLKLVKTNVDELIKKFNAEIITENFEDSYYGTYSFRINIPAQNFDTFLNSLEAKYGNPKNKRINATDETDRYYDTEARLKSKRQYRDKCLDLLKKATKISDIMEIEEKISSVQEYIESMEKNNAEIDYKVQNYHIRLEFITDEYDKGTYRELSFMESVWQSIKDGFSSLKQFILSIIGLWAYIILIFVVYKLYRRFRKKSKSEGKFFRKFKRSKENTKDE